MNIFTIAIIAIASLPVIAIILTGYLKAAPDEAIIISGLKKRKRFLDGASEAVGFDVKSIVGGFLGGKIANKDA